MDHSAATMEIPTGLEKDTIDHTVSILAPAFTNDVFQRYLMLDDLQSSNQTDIPLSLNEKVFTHIVPMFVEDGATLITVPGSTIASVWVLEDHTEQHKEDPHNPPAVSELNFAAHKARSRILSSPQKFLHLVLIANDRSQYPPSSSSSSSSSPMSPRPSIKNLISPILALAQEKVWPVCLEATSTRSRDVYAHLGFEVLEEMVLGKGKVDVDGRGKEGGEGIRVWAMVCGAEKEKA